MNKMFTPHTPRGLKKISAIFSTLFALNLFSVQSFGQSGVLALRGFQDSYKVDSVLALQFHSDVIYTFKELDSYFLIHEMQIAEEKKLAIDKLKQTKKKWWYWLPNIGFQFGFPSITFNSSTISQIDAENQKVQFQLETIEREFELRELKEIQEIRHLFFLIQSQLRLLQVKQTLLESHKLLFQDMSNQFVNNEIDNPRNLISAQINFWNTRMEITEYMNSISINLFKLDQLANSRY